MPVALYHTQQVEPTFRLFHFRKRILPNRIRHTPRFRGQILGIFQGIFSLGVLGLLCAKTRFVSIAAIPHILFHMCRQIGFALRATTKRGGLPSGFAAGTARRRFDLKVELQAIRLPFDIPTFGSRQAPRHEPGFARHEYPRISQLPPLFPRCVFLDRINRIYKILAVCKCFWRFHNPDNPVNPVQKKFCNCRK